MNLKKSSLCCSNVWWSMLYWRLIFQLWLCFKQIKLGRALGLKYRNSWNELATTLIKAASEVNMKQLYDATKKLARKYSKSESLGQGQIKQTNDWDSSTEEQMSVTLWGTFEWVSFTESHGYQSGTHGSFLGFHYVNNQSNHDAYKKTFKQEYSKTFPSCRLLNKNLF